MKRTAELALALVACRGTIGAKHFDENVIVPKGATCTLKNL